MKKRKKVAKVICTYLGTRRPYFNNPNDMTSYLDKNIEGEIKIDNKIDTDLIIVNNDCGNPEINKKLNKYDGVITKNGKIIVEQRENIGGSFGSYFDMFEKYSKDYDYWFFSEDDHIIYKKGYMKDFVDYLDSDEKLGYVGLAPVTTHNNTYPKHCGGSIGLTSTKNFLKVYGENSKCNFRNNMKSNSSYDDLQFYEYSFSSNFSVYGKLEITNHPDYSELPANCMNKNLFRNYRNFYNKENLTKEFIYIVGEDDDSNVSNGSLDYITNPKKFTESEIMDALNSQIGNVFSQKYKQHNPKFSS